jgi:hypothetical protein
MTSILSLNQARWVLADAPLDQVERIARRHDLPEVIARMICARGIAQGDFNEDEIAAFLKPTLKEHFPDPFALAGIAPIIWRAQ